MASTSCWSTGEATAARLSVGPQLRRSHLTLASCKMHCSVSIAQLDSDLNQVCLLDVCDAVVLCRMKFATAIGYMNDVSGCCSCLCLVPCKYMRAANGCEHPASWPAAAAMTLLLSLHAIWLPAECPCSATVLRLLGDCVHPQLFSALTFFQCEYDHIFYSLAEINAQVIRPTTKCQA